MHSAAAKEYADLLQADINRRGFENVLFPASAFKTQKVVTPPPICAQPRLI